jgi:nicotinamide-nucleotide amidase
MNALAVQVVETLSRRGLTVAVAESCTGGLIGHLLSDVPGSSRVFPGGIVAYGNQSKIDLLAVPAELLMAHGAVSAEVASAMAEGVRRVFGADIGIGVSGIIGPTGGSEEKPIGTVYIACAAQRVCVERHQWTGEGDQAAGGHAIREVNKRRSASAALELILRCAGGE